MSVLEITDTAQQLAFKDIEDSLYSLATEAMHSGSLKASIFRPWHHLSRLADDATYRRQFATNLSEAQELLQAIQGNEAIITRIRHAAEPVQVRSNDLEQELRGVASYPKKELMALVEGQEVERYNMILTRHTESFENQGLDTFYQVNGVLSEHASYITSEVQQEITDYHDLIRIVTPDWTGVPSLDDSFLRGVSAAATEAIRLIHYGDEPEPRLSNPNSYDELKYLESDKNDVSISLMKDLNTLRPILTMGTYAPTEGEWRKQSSFLSVHEYGMNSQDSIGYTDNQLARLEQGDLFGFHSASVNDRDDPTGRKVNSLLAATTKFSNLDSRSTSIIRALDSIRYDESMGLAEVVSYLRGAMNGKDSEKEG